MGGHLNSKLHQRGKEILLNAFKTGHVSLASDVSELNVYVKSQPFKYTGEDDLEQGIVKGDYCHGVNDEAIDRLIQKQVDTGIDQYLIVLDIKAGEAYGAKLDTMLKKGIDWTHGGRRIRMWGQWMFDQRVYTLHPLEKEEMMNLAVANQSNKDQGILF